MSNTFKYQVWALFAVFLWAVNGLVMKIGVKYIDSNTFNFFRFAFAVPLLIFYPKPKENILKLIVITIFWNIANFNFFVKGMEITESASSCVFIMQTGIIFGMVFNYLINKSTINRYNIVGMLIAFSGIYILMDPTLIKGFDQSMLFSLLGAISLGMGITLIKKYNIDGGLSNVIWLTVLAFFLQSIISFLYKGSLPTINYVNNDLIGVTCAFFSFVVSSIIAVNIWLLVNKKLSFMHLSAYLMFCPFIFVGLSVFFFDEQITPRIFLGGFLAIIGVGVNSFNCNSSDKL